MNNITDKIFKPMRLFETFKNSTNRHHSTVENQTHAPIEKDPNRGVNSIHRFTVVCHRFTPYITPTITHL
ncbi:hypothetical protein HanIR_Chr02g0095631 [Helianthus annuus]|nr:hypothetical protein HanIR_Chr02g0095631 [Helianthus annuus]